MPWLSASLDLLLFASACGMLMLGFPVAFTLAGTALAFAAIGHMMGVFDMSYMGALPQRIYTNMTNEVLLAVPLFVFMGVMLERSKVAEELLENMGRLFGRMRGGLSVSVAIVGALLAASTGIVGATVITMGLLALPTMLKNGYSPSASSGIIAASGTLGQVIPPSIVLVLLGDVLSSAYQDAQRRLGNWAPEPLSVGDLFAGALIPGLLLVVFYIAYQLMLAWLRPQSVPAIARAGEARPGLGQMLHAVMPPVVLIVAVLGSILAGIATPTEAAGVGAVGATFLAGYRANERRPFAIYLGVFGLVAILVLTTIFDLRLGRTAVSGAETLATIAAYICCALMAAGLAVSLWRTYRIGTLNAVMRSTMEITSMVFVILIGAAFFSLVFRGLGGEETVHALLTDLPGGTTGAIIAVMAMVFFLGFFLDFIEIVFVVVPIVAPVLFYLGVHPVWLGVMLAVNLQTSFLTPPFGFALFYLRGVAPDTVTTGHIYRGVVPYILIQIAMLGLIALFPALATWLPQVVFR